MTSNHFLIRLLTRFQVPNTSGVFSSDTIPPPRNMLPHKKFAIVNCSPLHQPGSHFVLVRVTSQTFHVFDPLGGRFKIQDDTSAFCGLHCLALCLMLAKYRWSLKDIQTFYGPRVIGTRRNFVNERRTLYFLKREIELE